MEPFHIFASLRTKRLKNVCNANYTITHIRVSSVGIIFGLTLPGEFLILYGGGRERREQKKRHNSLRPAFVRHERSRPEYFVLVCV